MTQSGQGAEPSARAAREGIVLPSDGGEPLLPGRTGGPGGPQPGGAPTGQQSGAPFPPAYGQQTSAGAPAGGQAWGRPWGPDQQQTPAPPPGHGWPTPPDQEWGTPADQSWGTPEPAAAAPSPQGATPSQPGPGPLPPEGAHSSAYGAGSPSTPGGQSSAYGAGTPSGPGVQQPYPGSVQGAQPPYTGNDPYAPGASSLPSAGNGVPGAPLPPLDEGATQYIPPVSAAPVPEGATQYLPPVAAAPVDEGPTQYIPPVVPGALPPEIRPEETQYLGAAPQGSAPGPLTTAGPQPGTGPLAPGADPDTQATQYIPPVTGQHGEAPAHGGRQTPAEFENLFRSGPGGDGPAGATRQLPRVQQPESDHDGYGAQSSYAPPTGPSRPGRRHDGGDEDGGGRGRRTGSRVPLIAAIGVGIVVVGIGAGALLGGGGGDQSDDDNKTVAASSPATDGSASAAADPAEQQAIALDKLLADSGSSRATVIRAVADVKACNNLDQAASDLRDAAEQRTDLVTRLSGLSVDKLPDHAALTSALTQAWQASASADNHYAAWADQVAGNKKLCKNGQARSTGQTQAGNRDSGTASTQKKTAARLWNAIATKYGLTQRQPTQL